MASRTSRSPPAPACSPTTAPRYPQQFQGPRSPLRSRLPYLLTHLSWFLSAETEGGGGFPSDPGAQRDSPRFGVSPGECPDLLCLPLACGCPPWRAPLTGSGSLSCRMAPPGGQWLPSRAEKGNRTAWALMRWVCLEKKGSWGVFPYLQTWGEVAASLLQMPLG